MKRCAVLQLIMATTMATAAINPSYSQRIDHDSTSSAPSPRPAGSDRRGAVHSIKIIHPEFALVGEPFDVTIELYDLDGKPVSDYDRTGADLQIRQGLSGASARFEPSRISCSAFKQGRARIRLRYPKPETVALQIDIPPAGGASAPFPVFANSQERYDGMWSLAQLEVIAAEHVRVGAPLVLQIIGRDERGNIIVDWSRRNAKILISAVGDTAMNVPFVVSDSFRNGLAFISVTPSREGLLEIQAEDELTKACGKSQAVLVGAAPAISSVRSIAKLDLNTASLEELSAIPEIGPTRARTLIWFRENARPILTRSDLEDVPGFDKARIDAMERLWLPRENSQSK